MTKDKVEVGAVSRRFSPDMKLRWMPTVEGKIIVGGAVPFSGFTTRSEALEAAKATVTEPSNSEAKRQRQDQATAFQSAIAEIVDQFLRDGLSVEIIKEVLFDEVGSDLYARRKEVSEP